MYMYLLLRLGCQSHFWTLHVLQVTLNDHTVSVLTVEIYATVYHFALCLHKIQKIGGYSTDTIQYKYCTI